MAAVRGKVAQSCLTTCFLRQTSIGSIATFPLLATRGETSIQTSHLHTYRGSRSPLVKAILGQHRNGQLLLVSSLSVRHNSTQTPADPVQTVSIPTPPNVQTLADVPVAIPDTTAAAVVDPSPVIAQPITEQLAEVAPTVADVLQGAGAEVRLAELGLGSYTPVGLVQNLLEYMHMDLGLPWWGAIVLGTVIARCAVFPVIVKGQREAAKLNNVMPDMTKLTNRMNEAKQSGNKFDFAKAYSDLMLFQKKNDINPLRGFLVPLVQMPVFVSFFIALRKMSYLPVPSLTTGGTLWFTDLTMSDPYYILPIAVTGTMFAILELGAESGVDNPNLKAMKTVLRVMPFVILPLTINFPTAVFTYWMTSNLFSLGQVALLKIPAVRDKFRIPERIVHPPSAMPQQDGFIDSIKKGWKNAQVAQQLEEREKRIKGHLDIAAKGPLRQTFTHNPLQQTAPASTSSKSAAGSKPGKKRPWEETIG
ncbi:mitochondrial inner membrane protein OXA1L isoform X1 [Alosa sapidissima]|uniref:mitochondrial inner membrane protein OXA1L isoform X1 n=1 Tax=Alosa sapidissima TaxID=34773 RepID=UPI001C080E9E|nr:mitochondrial inner membrane protein OXA1L isoform X1 [Alosa sapidissima]